MWRKDFKLKDESSVPDLVAGGEETVEGGCETLDFVRCLAHEKRPGFLDRFEGADE